MSLSSPDLEPVGYLALIQRFDLPVIPPFRRSYIAEVGAGSVEKTAGNETRIYASSYHPGDAVPKQLRFALRYEGVELGVLAELFRVIDPTEIEGWVRSEPTGKYSRRSWYLYEWLTGQQLDLPDLGRGSYEDAADPERYYTSTPVRSKRHRVRNNLPGVPGFCPMVRRTRALQLAEAENLDQRCREVLRDLDEDMLARAVDYLFTKETKSSFLIEREKPSASRARRFVEMLGHAGSREQVTEEWLTQLQNEIVEPRFAETGYRDEQNYVGQTLGWNNEAVHYVCPQPEHVRGLMTGLIDCHDRLRADGAELHPIVHAAIVSFGFVYVHPFEDGNGRIHRFLIHQVLSQRGFTPQGMIVPVSAAILDDRSTYDRALEAFSRPLLSLVDYDLDGDGMMTVQGDTSHHYRYPDFTEQAEALAAFMTEAISRSLVEELQFLRGYDQVREAVREVVDLPDKLLQLLLNSLREQRGHLSRKKRTKHFSMLTDVEVKGIESAYLDVFKPEP